MAIISVIATVIYVALVIFFWLMWARFILELVRTFRPGWRPQGVVLLLAEVVYTVTDPPVRFVRRFVKPIRAGGAAIDFSGAIVMLAVVILISVTLGFI